jgi:hypothetical protein
MTTATVTRTRRTAGLTTEQRRARQDQLLATLADGVQSLTTSDGWRRYLRAMTTLRTYSTGTAICSKPVNAPGCHDWRMLTRTVRARARPARESLRHFAFHDGHRCDRRSSRKYRSILDAAAATARAEVTRQQMIGRFS